MKELTAVLQEQPRDEWLNLDEFEMEGLKVVDERTLTITIKGLYPQFVYWLAMHFFSPIAPEVDRFYHNPGFVDRNLTLVYVYSVRHVSSCDPLSTFLRVCSSAIVRI